jgi:hypothetical protein
MAAMDKRRSRFRQANRAAIRELESAGIPVPFIKRLPLRRDGNG